ncbi:MULTISPECIES: DNA gyrase inhibitor YacG [unclassified Cellvibrio]|uniref:DNA gyrase inhibitor YacG n=1 Tax=unclassified Cellvibrio TaxID=2624793 RepID=UPI0009E54497|nr:DNA gyrase inhibitor YacG [Cellvibrio sp. pealriver]
MQESLNNTDLNTLKISCPTCKKMILWNESFPHRPFCSDRCRLIDLGEWASENHRIAGDNLDINSEDKHEF